MTFLNPKGMDRRMIFQNPGDNTEWLSSVFLIKKQKVSVTISESGRNASNLFNSQLIFQHRG